MSFREEAAGVRERRPRAIRASWTAEDWARSALISTIFGVFMAAAGAFGTAGMPLGLRLAYWIGVVMAGTPIAMLTFIGLGRIRWMQARPWVLMSLGTVLMALVYTFVVRAVNHALAPAEGQIRFLALFPIVLMISAGMTTLHFLVERRRNEQPVAGADKPSEIRFLQRLPLPLRSAELYAIEAEDHYLRVHTSKGSDLILCRLADAVAELEGVEGLRTHRSWWVARAAVTRVARGDGRATLTLVTGAEAPVSRSALPALREKGWV